MRAGLGMNALKQGMKGWMQGRQGGCDYNLQQEGTIWLIRNILSN